MSRGFPAAVATALAQQNVAIVTFAKLEFPSGTVYLHNSLGSYVWDSVTAGAFIVGATYTIETVGTTDFTAIGASANTVGIVFVATGTGTGTGTAKVNWFGVGDLGSISQVEEGLDVSPYAITLTLSGLDATISGAALTEDYYLHGVTVYLGVLDADDVLIDTPTQIWAGFMDQMNMTVGADGGDAIQLVAESELSRFNKSLNLMYTNTAQQERSTGDLFFNFLHRIEGAKINWGSRKPGSSTLGAPVIDPDDYKNLEFHS